VHKPSWREFLIYWMKFGFLSFGGPVAQIGMLHRDLVEKKQWLDDEEFSRALAFVSILPGPEAHQLATYIGRKHFGVKGGIVAGGLFILPSLFIISGLTWLYLEYAVSTETDVLLEGLRIGVLSLILYTTYKLSTRVSWNIKNISLALLLLILGIGFNVSIVLLVLLAIVFGFLTSEKSDSSSQVSLKPIVKPIGIGIVIWALSFALVFQNDELRAIASLFTQAALITFGGAYSVVPFVSEAAVSQYGWLTQAQMLDGIALGESTPGPLIMINAFVGYIAFSGILGALVATWFTFLPSFILVFASAPLMQFISDNQRLQKILATLSIAVITFIAGFAFNIYQSLNSQSVVLQISLALVGLLTLIKTEIPVVVLLLGTTLCYWVTTQILL
jgi:chromate transporter